MYRTLPLALLCALLLIAPSVAAGFEPPRPAYVALIIDDLGDRWLEGRRAVDLPGAVTVAVLPHTPHARTLAERAHAAGKEVMLHQPMQPVGEREPGRGALLLDMSREELAATVRANVAAVPHVVGINNHMGSLLTRHPGHMLWLMEELRTLGGLYFVDSRTTHATIAKQMAREQALPTLGRDVFLDHDPRPIAIEAQWRRLLAQARRTGAAVGIGHPYPETLDVLEAVLPELEGTGVRLVPVSDLLQVTDQRREPWRVSLSP
ncbi:divergent polysaccharide deacetylase family protein [Ectothiorhodospiraceae bacterium 2226]|nr:divergent polysaccharide deacetylase family protein [Ectothiorhodospiraceae bacterium 2226]